MLNTKTIQMYWTALLVFAITGCDIFVQKHSDPFYNDVGTWDSLRLPLINPYDLVLINKEYGWQMMLNGNFPDKFNHIVSLQNVEKVAVEKGVIMVYTSHAPNFDESLGQKPLNWFIAIPHEGNSEFGFEDEAGFLQHIQTLKIIKPQWVEPGVAYDEFFQTGCFYWIPDCN